MHMVVFLIFFREYLSLDVTITAPDSFQLVLQSVGAIFLIYSLGFPKNLDFRFFTLGGESNFGVEMRRNFL